MPSYDQEVKTVFSLSLFSNLAAFKKGTVPELEQQLYGDIETELKTYSEQLGPWSILWGPAIYQAPFSEVADNALYLAKQEGKGGEPDQIVVAIAGTNGISWFGWLVLDFGVAAQVKWQWGNPSPELDPKIAAGTYTGLTILQYLKPSAGLPGAGTTFRDFLKSNLNQETKLTVSGHSLGGALSPVTALWLLDTQDKWDKQKYAEVFCIPSAGPTVGNTDFSRYYDEKDELGTRTIRIFNELDVVTQAWNLDALDKVPNDYNPPIEPDLSVDSLVYLAKNAAKNGDYYQILPEAESIASEFNPGSYDPDKTVLENFFAQMLYQHVNAYIKYLDIPELEPVGERLSETANLYGPKGQVATIQKLMEEKTKADSAFNPQKAL